MPIPFNSLKLHALGRVVKTGIFLLSIKKVDDQVNLQYFE